MVIKILTEVSLDIAKTTSYATTNKGALNLAKDELKILWYHSNNSQRMENLESVRNLGSGMALYDQMWQKLKQK